MIWKSAKKSNKITGQQAGKENEIGKFEHDASVFVSAIKTIASKPENLENLENYLPYHFEEWLEKFANTPADISCELREFANMDI